MIELEAQEKFTEKPEKEIHRVVFRRRGSDLIFAATDSNKVQVSRFNHRFKTTKTYVHDASDINSNLVEIKAFLEKEGYKHLEDGAVGE